MPEAGRHLHLYVSRFLTPPVIVLTRSFRTSPPVIKLVLAFAAWESLAVLLICWTHPKAGLVVMLAPFAVGAALYERVFAFCDRL